MFWNQHDIQTLQKECGASLPLGSSPTDQHTRVEENVMQLSALYFYLDVVLDVVHGGQRITKFEWPSPILTMMEHSQKIPQWMKERCLHKREGRRMLCSQVHCISISMSSSRFWMYTEGKERITQVWTPITISNNDEHLQKSHQRMKDALIDVVYIPISQALRFSRICGGHMLRFALKFGCTHMYSFATDNRQKDKWHIYFSTCPTNSCMPRVTKIENVTDAMPNRNKSTVHPL